MSCPFNKESLLQLKQFIDICKQNTCILQSPELRFFKDFVESFGGRVPEKIERKEMPKTDEAPQEAPAEAAGEESDTESVLDFDTEGCMEPDELSDDQEMGDLEKQPTEEDMDKAEEIRGTAMGQYSEGNFEKAVELFSEAITVNPHSAILYTKRGQSYIKLNKPNACIKDCTRALELNCDSALAHKWRGRAYRLLGDWESAARDLRQASKIDLDEQTDEWLKEVQPNAYKIEQHKLKQERKKVAMAEKERQERLKKAKEAHQKAAESAATEAPPGETGPAGGAGAAGAGGAGMNEFYKLMQDPEIMAAFQDPEVTAAFQDISANPANIIKYQNNPKVKKLIEKLSTKFSSGGMGFPFGGAAGGGFPGGFPGAAGFPGGFPGGPEKDDGLD